ncbi:hypothetical protein TNCV_3543051 [Trichonephila clavipes]|nr:hypothetical protein TNCV_3543051 [Trichonephila clavipes]
MLRCKIRAHYEQLSEIEKVRIIKSKGAGWVNRRIARHMGRSDAAIRRCCQEWPDPVGRHYRHTYSTVVHRRHSDNCFATVSFAVPWLFFQQDNTRPYMAHVAMTVVQLVKHFLGHPDH